MAARPINGIIFKLTVGELGPFDVREKQQIRVEVPWEYIELYSPDDYRVDKTLPVYIYKMHPRHSSAKYNGYAPSQAYIDTTVNGLVQHDDNMAKMFFENTVGLPRYMNTFAKWKKNIKTRMSDYLIAAHYGAHYGAKN
jgi:hypothetical protein